MIEKLFILIYFTHGFAQEFPLLPGVEDVRSGYDGAKMLSATEQNSRYRIFDLGDLRQTPFVLKTLSQSYSYAVPSTVQTSDVSTRKENNCESVSYSFNQFYSR